MLFLIVCTVVASGIIGALIGRAYERNQWQQRLLERTGLIPEAPNRLTDSLATLRGAANPDPVQLGQALDAIAVEVERIGEGQRFLTKLLAERDKSGREVKMRSPLPGMVRSPIPPAV